MPKTVLPLAGELMLATGALVSAILLTVTVADALALLPAASFAVATMLCVPFENEAVAQEQTYGEVASEHIMSPSTVMVTEVTPTLSLAEAWMVIGPETMAPLVGEVMLTVGGVVSALLTVTDIEAAALLLAASFAVAVIVWLAFDTVAVLQEHV